MSATEVGLVVALVFAAYRLGRWNGRLGGFVEGVDQGWRNAELHREALIDAELHDMAERDQ